MRYLSDEDLAQALPADVPGLRYGYIARAAII